MIEIDGLTASILAVSISGALLTIARRYKNKDDDAGEGIAGWSLFVIICLTGLKIWKELLTIIN